MAGRIFPVTFVWRDVEVVDDDGVVGRQMAMVPLGRFLPLCKRQFVDGEEYSLAPIEARTRASHSHYFAAIHDAFENLPESIAARWPTAEHLRKWCLVEAGYFDEKEFDCDDEKQARRLGNFIRTEDEYARISLHRSDSQRVTVIVRRAKSQAAAAMGKDEFEKSKRAVLDLLEHMIGVERDALSRNAGTSA